MNSVNYIQAKEIINSLNTGEFYCECPCGCGEEIKLQDAGLFYLDDFTLRGKRAYQELLDDLQRQRQEIIEEKKSMKSKPQIAAKAVNIGLILERIAPTFMHFPFERNDCRSVFDPIDYIIFEGLNKTGTVSKIIFTDIKSGASRLSSKQKEIKSLIENKKIEFKMY